MTSQLVSPAALAQSQSAGGAAPAATQTTPPPPAGTTDDAASPQTDQQVEVSTPGYDPNDVEDIVVVGRNIPNTVRATPQVISVLSSADIARTGEGDIAGALARVTGLSVVGNGFVYVRGLGDRYSSSLLNGSPLPSPEPLRRSIPLDIFPTTVIGSALVQKSYSVNYPGEFGGGVINLTTKAIPEKTFISLGGSVSADTATSSELGYVYDGGKHDFLGFDDGTRRVPGFITAAPNGTGILSTAQVNQLTNAQTTLLQTNNQIPFNYSAETSAGTAFDLGSTRIGIIGSASASNTFKTRSISQQDAITNTGAVRNDFRTLITDNRAVATALLGLGAEFGENKLRLTGLYIHDTDKQARGSVATVYNNSSGAPRFTQNTSWFERQLIEGQAVGEFKLTDAFSIDVRGAYANSKRLSPYERQFDYLCNQTLPVTVTNPNGTGGVQCNGIYQATNTFGPFATVNFSRLEENLYSGQADASYKLSTERPFTLSAGYYYYDTQRTSDRLPFTYQTNTGGSIPYPYNIYRPDYLLGSDITNGACPTINDGFGPGCVRLRFTGGTNGAYSYDASLKINAGYAQAEAEAADGLRATIGVRYESADERVTPIGTAVSTRLKNDYFLPAATVTWNFAQDMQARVNFSKTIARPQFRELAPQQYQDFESDRLFFGNPALKDSELYNLEARYEWFFGRDQRITASGFYKRIDNPIEQVGFRPTPDARLQTGFSYVPSATLYGVEAEVQKYFPLDFLNADFFSTRRLLVLANYTYTQSSINASSELVPDIANGPGVVTLRPANLLFRDGAPLTGQSDHLVNLQLGIEDTASLSQVTVLFNYASDRITNRGPSNLSGVGFLPDLVEHPGIRLDVVARQGFELAGGNWELKFEARNLTKTRYREDQTFSNGAVVSINTYNLGRVFSLGLSTTF